MEERHERLRRAREAAGFKTAAEAARRLGVPYGTYSGHENGQRGIKPEDTARYAKAFKVPVAWLQFGEGAGLRERTIERVPIEDEDDTTSPQMAESLVDGVSRRDVGDVPADAILEADLRIGLGGGGVSIVTSMSGEDGTTYAAEGVRDWFRLPEHVVSGMFRTPAKRIRCFEAVGDSMHPTVLDGDMVFVDVGHRMPSPPGIYALADVLGGVVLKRLEISSGRSRDEHDPIEVRIISDNPKHGIEVKTLDEIAIIGRYLGRLTTF